jgi:hypothetical protein
LTAAPTKVLLSERTLVSLSLLLTGIGLWLHTLTLGFADLGGAFSPVFFPRIVLSLWILLAVLSLGIDVVVRQPADKTRWPVVLILIAALLAYVYLLQPVGFLISSVAFSILILTITGQRRALEIIGFSLAIPATLVILFNHVLTMPLPVSPFFWWV